MIHQLNMREDYKEMGYWYETNMSMETHNILFTTLVYFGDNLIATIQAKGWELDVNVNDIIKSHIRDKKLRSLGL